MPPHRLKKDQPTTTPRYQKTPPDKRSTTIKTSSGHEKNFKLKVIKPIQHKAEGKKNTKQRLSFTKSINNNIEGQQREEFSATAISIYRIDEGTDSNSTCMSVPIPLTFPKFRQKSMKGADEQT